MLLIVRGIILGKNIRQSHLIIIRECIRNNITYILSKIFQYFTNFILIPST